MTRRKYADSRETNRVMSSNYRLRTKAEREAVFAERARPKPQPLTTAEAVQLYRDEKAKSEARNAPKKAGARWRTVRLTTTTTTAGALTAEIRSTSTTS